MSIENAVDQSGPPTLICESFDCRKWEGEKLIMPKLMPKWHGSRGAGAWFYCCSKCGASYGQKPHPDLPDLAGAKLAR